MVVAKNLKSVAANRTSFLGISFKQEYNVEEVYFAGGCLWGVQEFIKHLTGVINTEAGRINGSTNSTQSQYDGYAECVRTVFDPNKTSLTALIDCYLEIIDPFSLNKQGNDCGKKYRTGIYSSQLHHLAIAKQHIASKDNAEKMVIEILPLSNYVKSDIEHQDRLTLHPNDYCHIPLDLLHKYA